MTGFDNQFFINAIESAIRREIEEKSAKIIEQAKKDIQLAVESSVDKIALAVMSQYSLDRIGNDLMIRVHVKKG